MAKLRISPVLLIVLLIVVFFGISLLFRIYYPHDQIFAGDEIRYSSNDAYFYMRLVDNVESHFPHLTQFDPYFLYPGGNNVSSLPLFHWIIALLAWIVGGGHPTQHIIDLIGVYLPAIMGALTVIPVFFIGKALFNKWAGVLAAGLVAVLPGEFMSRSILGAGDNPVAEVLFTATALAFLIYAIKTASQNQLTFAHLWKHDWKIILKPLILSLFAGIFLGLYLATWQGALIFVFIFALYLLIQFIINHLAHKSSDYLCIIGVVTLLLAFIILMLNPLTTDVTIAMVIAVLVPLVLYGISRFMSKLKTFYYPLTLIGIGVVLVAIVYFAAPDIFTTLLAKFKFVFFPVGSTANTTIEMLPALIPSGDVFTTITAWGNFTTSFFIAPWWLIPGLIAAAICGYFFYMGNKEKTGTPLLVFFIVAAAIMIALTVQQFVLADAPSRYQWDAQLIPGIAFIALSVLFYSFIRRDKNQPWYIATGWVVGILILLLLFMIATTYVDYRYFALLPLAIFIFILFKQNEGKEHLRLFIIWSLIILIMLLIQRRYQYYFAVNVAVLSGYLCWEIIRLSGINKLMQKSEDTTKKELSFVETPKKQNYYEVLGINKNASYKEIKSAFRRLISTYHPGPGNTPETEEKIRELNRAYQTLTNPSLRASYDSSIRGVFEREKWKNRKSGHGNALNYVNVILSIVVVFLFVFSPNIAKAQAQSSQVIYAITDDWQAALLWMRDNTPDPMGDPDAYYKYYDALRPGESFTYPESAYGVTSWWDYGYWIIRIAHRIPSASPSQSPDPIIRVANLFLSQDQSTAERIRKELGSSYVIIDDGMVDPNGKFFALVDWAGQDQEKYRPIYYMPQSNQLVPVRLLSVDYYRTLMVRLYNFNGQAVAEQRATVIAYKIVKTSTGVDIRQITDAQDFTTYQEALDYIAKQDTSKDPSVKYDIVGTDPFVTPISLEAVANYQEIFNSAASNNSTTPVKIFQFMGNK